MYACILIWCPGKWLKNQKLWIYTCNINLKAVQYIIERELTTNLNYFIRILQTSLNTMKDYCSMFDLENNIDKTKVMIFSRGKLRKPHYFNYGDQNIEVVNEYNYLGLFFNYNAKFNVAKNNLYQKGSKAMFSLLKKLEKCHYLSM